MGFLMTGAFVSQWALTRIAAPGISWFVAATAQLTSNAAVKVIPGGVVAGGASTSRCSQSPAFQWARPWLRSLPLGFFQTSFCSPSQPSRS